MADDRHSTPEKRAEQQAEAKRTADFERLEKIANARIEEIRTNPMLTREERDKLIGQLQRAIDGARTTGDLAALARAVVHVVIAEKIEESDRDPASMALYHDFTASDLERIDIASRTVDVKSRRSVNAFVKAVMGEDATESMTDHLMKHPQMIENWNKASPAARKEAMAAYLKGKQNILLLEQQVESDAAKEQLKRADALGLEADADVQRLLWKAKKGKINETELTEKLQHHNDQHYALLKQEMASAAQTVIARDPTKADLIEKDPERIGEISGGVFRKRRENKDYVMTPKEAANMEVFLLSKQAVLLQKLGNNALTIDKEMSLERDQGTIEQRTERAMTLLQSRRVMVPELANMPEASLRKYVQRTLEEADKKGIKISELDTLKGDDLLSFSMDVSAVQKFQQQKDAFRDAERAMQQAGVSGGEQVAVGENRVPSPVVQVPVAAPRGPAV